MKIRVTLKDPDGFFDAVSEAVEASVAAAGELTDDEAEALSEARQKRIWTALAPWVEYEEYVELEFDTEAGAARVLRRDGKDDEALRAVAELLVTIQNYRRGVDWFEDLERSSNAAARAIGEPEFAAGWWREEVFP